MSENSPKGPSKAEIAALAAAAAFAGGATTAHAAESPPPPAKVHHQTKEEKEMQRASNIAARLLGVPKSEVRGDKLRFVDELPGYSEHVSPETRQMLKNSTLELLVKGKSEVGPYRPLCTATKVSFHGHEYVMTAGHCLTRDANADLIKADGWPAQNIVNTSTDQYAVSIAGDFYPLAYADGVSYYYPDRGDFALLSVQPNTKGSTSEFSEFAEMPAIDLTKLKPAPKLGSEVALYSDPAAHLSLPVMENGRYLGRVVSDWKGESVPHEFDIVGIDPKDPYHDACNYGSSGSMAIGANGFMFGPLTWRENIGYASGITNTMGTENPTANLKWRVDTLEKKLGIDTSGFATICAYQVIKHNADEQVDTMNSLIQGFGHFPDAYPPPDPNAPLK